MPRDHWDASRRSLLLAVFALPIVIGIADAVRRAWVCDDIFITFRYIDHWLRGHGLVYNAGERVEGYTHFLWVVILAFFHRLGIDLVFLGRYLPIVAYAAILAILFRYSLTQGRGWLAVPLAAWGFALHKDAQIYASSGLETSPFALALLAGLLIVTGERPRIGLAACVYAAATLLRPEGLLYTVAAGAYVLWRWRTRHAVALFVGVWTGLFAPFLIWRFLYYNAWVPNTYHAKSASLAWWIQGWWYTSYYFGIYLVLTACLVVAIVVWSVRMRPRIRPGDAEGARRAGNAAPMILRCWPARRFSSRSST